MKALIFYKINPTFHEDKNLTIKNLIETHVMVTGLSNVKDLEDVFYNMQAEIWSPNGEKRDLIIGLELHHTSMSVGDVVMVENGDYFECAGSGWNKLEKE